MKTTNFKPEYVGKLNFYLAALDHSLKRTTDNPSIGMLLCKTKKKLAVEYALENFTSPIGVASYETNGARSTPDSIKANLPTVEQIEELLRDTNEEVVTVEQEFETEKHF